METHLIALILGSATILGTFICLNLILLKKGNRLANKILAFLTLIFSAITFQNMIGFSGYYNQLPHMVFPFYPFNGLIGPLFLFYVLLQLDPNRSFKWKDSLHLAGFIFFVYEHTEFLLLPSVDKIKYADWIYSNKELFITKSNFIGNSLRKLFEAIYVAIAIFYIQKKKNELKDVSSSSRIRHLRWLKNFSLMFLGVTIFSCFLYFAFYFSHINLGYFETYVIIIKAAVINIIGFLMFQYTDRFSYVIKTPSKSPKVVHSINGNITIQQVIEMIEIEQPYLNSELKIEDLAKTLKIPKHTLSILINKDLGLNFYDLINQYRVDEFKKRIKKNQHKDLSLLGVALEVGFNSKSSFNRIFKKQTGKTPSQFINNK